MIRRMSISRREGSMLKNMLAGIVVATCAVAALQAQGAGRGAGQAARPEFPTAKQFAESKDAQAHVANAMKIGGSDMAAEAKWFCTATGPQRVALARQAAGLPRIPTEPVGPIKLFDNLYYVGVNDGQKLTLGDTTVTLVRLPGHTPGTIGMIVPAKFKGQTHMVMIMSGTQMPTQDSLDSFKHVFTDYAKAQRVETFLGSHPDILMNSLTAMEGVRDNYPAGNHPLLMSAAKAGRYSGISRECGWP